MSGACGRKPRASAPGRQFVLDNVFGVCTVPVAPRVWSGAMLFDIRILLPDWKLTHSTGSWRADRLSTHFHTRRRVECGGRWWGQDRMGGRCCVWVGMGKRVGGGEEMLGQRR